MDGVKHTKTGLECLLLIWLSLCIITIMAVAILLTSILFRNDMEVSCIFMEDCILPCSFQGGTDVEIHWTATKEMSGSVHHYRDNQDQLTDQDQHFRGRTSLFKDKISRGNASLQLTGVKVQDEGRYRCYTSTISGNQESFINLRVDVLSMREEEEEVKKDIRDAGFTVPEIVLISVGTVTVVVVLIVVIIITLRKKLRPARIGLIGQEKSIQSSSNIYETLTELNLYTTEEFYPDISVDENKETYKFSCSRPGLYRCSETGLVFHMAGEGDVVYRTVPWNHRLLTQHHKKPAGPLFDIKCLQQSVCQLHLPHCEIRSTGGCKYLSVAHVKDEGVEFITPHEITETCVIINITGFSSFGNVKHENSPPDPVRALVLLFYRPPTDPDPESLLNVLLLPDNVVVADVRCRRKMLVGDERYIETSPHCKLHPEQKYKLSTSPEDDSVLVQPTEAEFYCDNYDNYFPSFQVILRRNLKHMKLFVEVKNRSLSVMGTIMKYIWYVMRDSNRSYSVWESEVCLLSSRVSNCLVPLTLVPHKLKEIRTNLIEGISGPVLKSLLDKLLEKNVMSDAEMESAEAIKDKRDKARFIVDTVRHKGEDASLKMVEFLCEDDPFLCQHLGLM